MVTGGGVQSFWLGGLGWTTHLHRPSDCSACQRCHEAASIVATEAGLAHRQKRKRPEQSLAFEWGGTWRLPLRQEPPQPFGHGGEINSSGLSCLIGVDLRATGFVLVQVELLEQLALPNQQIGQPAFMLE